MANFVWRGIKSGKYAEGEIGALNADEAAYLLKKDKVIITSLIETSPSKKKKNQADGDRRTKKAPSSVPLSVLAIFTKKMAVMVRSGLPILETLKMLGRQTENAGMRYVIEQIYADVEGGTGLSDAFARHPQVFDSVYVNLLRAGETSGRLDEFMSQLMDNMIKTQAIRKKVKSALSYPIILLTVAIAVIMLMMIYVVPVFQDMFKNSAHGLPAPTQLVVNISEFLRSPMGGGLLAGSVGFSILAFKVALKSSPAFKARVDALVLKIPVVGQLTLNSSLAKVAMIQGQLAAAGVSVLETIDIVVSSLTNVVLQNAMTDVKRGVYSGSPLSELYERRPEVFPMTFSAMVQVGERTGRLDEMFAAVANYYEEETETDIERLTGMLEPLMIVFLGGVIGFILVAMYMPMFALGQAI